jgi:hypothetical protein
MEALLENLPLAGNDLSQGRVLRLRIIPLVEGPLRLGPFQLQFDALTLEAPVVAFTVLPATPPSSLAGSANSASPPDSAGSTSPANPENPANSPGSPEAPASPVPSNRDRERPPAPSFPAFSPEGPALFQKAAEAAAEEARLLWETGRYAEALGVLRGGERDLMGAYSLTPLRRAAEEALGIRLSMDEKWRPRNFLLGISLGSLGLFLAAIPFALFHRRRRKNNVTSRAAPGYKIIIPALLVIFIWAFFGYMNPGGNLRLGENRAVLRSCTAYRVPDSQGAVSAFWGEGQPVLIHSVKDLWVYAEVPGGEAGWVRREYAVFY